MLKSKKNESIKARNIVDVVKDKSIVKVKVKKEMMKSEDVKVKSPDTLFKEELLSQVKEMRDIFESALIELSEVKVSVKAIKERFI